MIRCVQQQAKHVLQRNQFRLDVTASVHGLASGTALRLDNETKEYTVICVPGLCRSARADRYTLCRSHIEVTIGN